MSIQLAIGIKRAKAFIKVRRNIYRIVFRLYHYCLIKFYFNDCRHYLYLLTIILSLRWMHCKAMNETFGSCKPWAHDNLTDNLNILSNFKQNLHSYEKVYKKYSLKIRPLLPSIQNHPPFKSRVVDRSAKKMTDKIDKTINKILQSNSNESQTKGVVHKNSQELKLSKSELKIPKTVEEVKRGRTSMQMANKQNNEVKEQKCVLTQRPHYDPYISSKGSSIHNVCLISFDEQYKYRRLRKRDLHQQIFGQRQKTKKRPATILR